MKNNTPKSRRAAYVVAAALAVLQVSAVTANSKSAVAVVAGSSSALELHTEREHPPHRQPLMVANNDEATSNPPVRDDCIEFSAEGFRLMATNYCNNALGDLWVCRSDASESGCANKWQKLGKLKRHDSVQIKKVYQTDGSLFYRACYDPYKIVETPNGYRCE